MKKKSLIAISIFLFLNIIHLFFPTKIKANDDTSLLQFGMIITYASLCGEKFGIAEDEATNREATIMAQLLVDKFGPKIEVILPTTAVLGVQTFEKDHGSQCLQMLTAAKNIMNGFGLRGIFFERALARLQLQRQDNGTTQNQTSRANTRSANVKLTDDHHTQFLSEDNDYALADAMLNATWKMVKKNLDKSAFVSVQKDQREWASSKRDERAASYAASMPPSQAYTKVMQERIAELASLVAREPRLGDYESQSSVFNISKNKGEYQIDGSSDNAAGNTCMFEGKLTKNGGWYKVHEGGFPPYYVLFTDKGAFIEHAGSGDAFDCGANVDFKGEYKFVK